MDKGNYTFEHSDYGSDIHTVASLLKKFLKDLPDALIPDHMYEHFQNCARIPDPEIQLNTLKQLVVGLPTAHYHTLRFLMKHLAKIVAHSDQNKVRTTALVTHSDQNKVRTAAFHFHAIWIDDRRSYRIKSLQF